jgi:hypothetical protein
MKPRRKNVRRRGAKRGTSLKEYVGKFDTNHPDHWVSTGWDQLAIGSSSGAIGDGSFAFTPYYINNNSALTLGTYTDQRLGAHVIYTRLLIRAYAQLTLGTRLRVMVLANPRDGLLQNITSNTGLTGEIEAAPFLESPSYGATFGPIDNPISPACDYTVLFDQMYGCGVLPQAIPTATQPITVGAGVQVTTALTPIEMDLSLMLPCMFDNNGLPQTGDFVVYMVSSAANAHSGTAGYANCLLSGYVQMQYVDAMNLEAIGRTIRDFVDEAGNTLDHIAGSRLLRWGAAVAPYITRLFV